ncbi:MAG TPA: crosslink repair DNA glycosylase YcaQ family protein [Candidatus Dormibacteraeota bacterium]
MNVIPGSVRSLDAAAAFVDRVGLALVFPKEGVALPSLFEAVAGPSPTPWAEEREGKLTMTPDLALVWAWKDQLPEARRACAGKHVRGVPALVSLALLPALYALTGRSGAPDDFRDAVLPPLEREVAEAVLESAPADARAIRRVIGRRDTAAVNRAIDSLQRRLVLTRAGVIEKEQGWPGTAYDVLPRRYPLGALPEPERARADLAAAVLRAAGTLSAADLARALGFARAEAVDALERVAGGGEAEAGMEGRVPVWTAAVSRPAGPR